MPSTYHTACHTSVAPNKSRLPCSLSPNGLSSLLISTSCIQQNPLHSIPIPAIPIPIPAIPIPIPIPIPAAFHTHTLLSAIPCCLPYHIAVHIPLPATLRLRPNESRCPSVISPNGFSSLLISNLCTEHGSRAAAGAAASPYHTACHTSVAPNKSRCPSTFSPSGFSSLLISNICTEHGSRAALGAAASTCRTACHTSVAPNKSRSPYTNSPSGFSSLSTSTLCIEQGSRPVAEAVFTAAHHLPRLLHFRQLRHKQSRGPSTFSPSGFSSLLLNTLCTENSSRAVAAAAVDSAQHLPRLDGCAQTNHARPHVFRQAAFVHCCYRLCTPKTYICPAAREGVGTRGRDGAGNLPPGAKKRYGEPTTAPLAFSPCGFSSLLISNICTEHLCHTSRAAWHKGAAASTCRTACHTSVAPNKSRSPFAGILISPSGIKVADICATSTLCIERRAESPCCSRQFSPRLHHLPRLLHFRLHKKTCVFPDVVGRPIVETAFGSACNTSLLMPYLNCNHTNHALTLASRQATLICLCFQQLLLQVVVGRFRSAPTTAVPCCPP